MIKLYLQKQDNENVLIGDEFFDIPLYPKKDWDVVPEELHSTEIESEFSNEIIDVYSWIATKGEFQIEERAYRFNIVK